MRVNFKRTEKELSQVAMNIIEEGISIEKAEELSKKGYRFTLGNGHLEEISVEV